jgi:hypothetical protein
VELWNQTNDYYNIFKEEHEVRGDHLCPCAEMSSSIVAKSTEVDHEGKADFQVVERAVQPWSRVDTEIIQPLLTNSYNVWMGNLTRINLFNTVFSSRGDTRGVFHFHNYEAFCNFVKVLIFCFCFFGLFHSIFREKGWFWDYNPSGSRFLFRFSQRDNSKGKSYGG